MIVVSTMIYNSPPFEQLVPNDYNFQVLNPFPVMPIIAYRPGFIRVVKSIDMTVHNGEIVRLIAIFMNDQYMTSF